MIMNTRYMYHIRGRAENAWKDQWYIGSRTATDGRTPEEDIGIRYFTSSTDDDFVAQFKAHPEWFVCTILERGYADDRTMGEDEERRITESWNVPGRINRTDGVILYERDERYQETRRKMHASPKWKAAVAAGNRKKALDSEWKAKMTALNRKMHANPEHQETRRKMHASPEWKAKQAAGSRKRSQDPEYQETRRKMYANPEWKVKMTATNRKNAQDPEWKANHAAAMRKKALDPELGKKISDGIKRARALREADNC